MGAFTHLTFDCYGTLIDWEQGILSAVDPILARGSHKPAPQSILQSFVAHEARIEAGDWRPYRDVLREVLARMAADFGAHLPDSKANLLSDSLPCWSPFPDTVAALKELSQKFRLVILSNTDDSLFAGTQKVLGIPFDEVITSEQVKSYKPRKAHFQEALRRLGVPVSEILHVAQSLYHDHVPARQLGFRTACIKRPSLLADSGLAPETNIIPDFTFSGLAGLADALLAI